MPIIGGKAHAMQNRLCCTLRSSGTRWRGSGYPSRYGLRLRPVEILCALLFPAERLLPGLCSFATRLLAQVRGSQSARTGASVTTGVSSPNARDQEGCAHGTSCSSGIPAACPIRPSADHSTCASCHHCNGRTTREFTSYGSDQPHATFPHVQLTVAPVRVQRDKIGGTFFV